MSTSLHRDRIWGEKMSKPIISVVIPIDKRPEMPAEALASVRAQTRTIEVLVGTLALCGGIICTWALLAVMT